MRLGQTSFIGFLSQFTSSIIGFIATIYITRTLGAAVFGEYMLAISLVIWLQIIGVIGVEHAVTKRLSETGESEPYFTAGGGLVLVTFLLLSILVLLFAEQVNRYVGSPVAVYFPGLLLAGIMLKFISAVLRGEHKVHIAVLLGPVDRTIRSTLQIVAVFLSVGLVGLLASYVVGGILAALCGLYFLSVGFRRPKREHLRGITSYARYAWLGKLSSRAFSAMDTVVLGLFVTSSYVGYYEAAWNIASILAIFGIAIAKTLFPEMSRVASEDNPEQVGELVTEGLSYTGLFLIPGLVGSVLIGDLVMQVYGNEFQQSMTVLIILVTSRLVYEYGNQFITGLNALDRPDLAFRVNAIFIVVNIGLNMGLIAVMGWIGAAIATSTSAVVTTILAYRALSQLVSIELPFRKVGMQVIAALGMGVVINFVRIMLPERVLVGIILVGLGTIVYVLLLTCLSEDFRKKVRQNLPSHLIEVDSE